MESFSIATEDDLLVLLPEGDITSFYSDIEQAVKSNLICAGTTLIVNMERVDHISSDGVDFLIRLKNLADAFGGRMILYNPKKNVINTIKVLNLDKLLCIAEIGAKSFININSSKSEKIKLKIHTD